MRGKGMGGYALKMLLLAFLALLSSACASAPPPLPPVFAAPNVVRVCIRPQDVPSHIHRWAYTPGGTLVTQQADVDVLHRNGLGEYVYDPHAPAESVALLPIRYNHLQCPSKPALPKPTVVVTRELPKENKEIPAPKTAAPKATPRPAPKVVAAAKKKCVAWYELGQARPRLRAGTVGTVCLRKGTPPAPKGRLAHVRLIVPNSAPPKPPAIKPPEREELPAQAKAQYEDWGVEPPDVSALAADRANECLSKLCHARHPNFIPKGKPEDKPRDGQSLSNGGDASSSSKPKASEGGSTVKTTEIPAGKATNGGTAAPGARKVPNPNGRKGGAEHRANVEKVVEEVEKRGLKPKKEYRVETPGGHKNNRYVDVAGLDKKNKPVEMHQVGKQTKDGRPVARERKAMDDIEGAGHPRPEFHPYNKK